MRPARVFFEVFPALCALGIATDTTTTLIGLQSGFFEQNQFLSWVAARGFDIGALVILAHSAILFPLTAISLRYCQFYLRITEGAKPPEAMQKISIAVMLVGLVIFWIPFLNNFSALMGWI